MDKSQEVIFRCKGSSDVKMLLMRLNPLVEENRYSEGVTYLSFNLQDLAESIGFDEERMLKTIDEAYKLRYMTVIDRPHLDFKEFITLCKNKAENPDIILIVDFFEIHSKVEIMDGLKLSSDGYDALVECRKRMYYSINASIEGQDTVECIDSILSDMKQIMLEGFNYVK